MDTSVSVQQMVVIGGFASFDHETGERALGTAMAAATSGVRASTSSSPMRSIRMRTTSERILGTYPEERCDWAPAPSAAT